MMPDGRVQLMARVDKCKIWFMKSCRATMRWARVQVDDEGNVRLVVVTEGSRNDVR